MDNATRRRNAAYLAGRKVRLERSRALLEWCRANQIGEIARKLDAEAKRILEIRRKFES